MIELVCAPNDTSVEETTFFDFIKCHAARHPDNPALINAATGAVVSYALLVSRVEQLAGKLSRLGISPGNVVVVFMPRSVELVELILAVSLAGGACLPYVSPRDPEKALASARNLRPVLIVYSRERGRVERFAESHELWIESQDIYDITSTSPDFVPRPGRVLYLNESSGTSGVPKIVEATQEAIIANTMACVETFNITEKDIHLCTFLSHAHEFFARALFSGGSAVLVPDNVVDNASAVLDAIIRYKVSCLMSNSASIAALTSVSVYWPEKFSLRLVESGGMPTSEFLKKHVSLKFGAPLIPVWGSTETSGVSIATPLDANTREYSVGKPIPGYEVSIVDEEGQPVKPGDSGEMIISGKGVGESYKSSESSHQLNRGTFRTGDIAKSDSEGWIYIRGRLSNQFKVCGLAVSAEEIEDGLCKNPHVEQAAVLPIFNRLLGYVPAAIIVIPDRARLFARESEKRFLKRLIKDTKLYLGDVLLETPRYVKCVSEPLPLTSAGKLDRLRVRKLYDESPLQPVKIRASVWSMFRLVRKRIGAKTFWVQLLSHPRATWQLFRKIR
jgi:long-chain acyl-CoA synthetase